jgi:hypothetical protein
MEYNSEWMHEARQACDSSDLHITVCILLVALSTELPIDVACPWHLQFMQQQYNAMADYMNKISYGAVSFKPEVGQAEGGVVLMNTLI